MVKIHIFWCHGVQNKYESFRHNILNQTQVIININLCLLRWRRVLQNYPCPSLTYFMINMHILWCRGVPWGAMGWLVGPFAKGTFPFAKGTFLSLFSHTGATTTTTMARSSCGCARLHGYGADSAYYLITSLLFIILERLNQTTKIQRPSPADFKWTVQTKQLL